MSLCYDAWTIESVLYLNFILDIQTKGPFKYYVIKEMVGWGGQMMMFDDKVGGYQNLLLRISLISLIQVTDFFSGKMN